MAEWSAHQTRNPVVMGLSPALTTCGICSQLSHEFKSSATLVNSQLVASCQENYLFLSI